MDQVLYYEHVIEGLKEALQDRKTRWAIKHSTYNYYKLKQAKKALEMWEAWYIEYKENLKQL